MSFNTTNSKSRENKSFIVKMNLGIQPKAIKILGQSNSNIIPKIIEAKYENNYNILTLNNTILRKIQFNMSPEGQNKIRMKIAKLESEMEAKIPMTYNDHSKYMRRITYLTDKMNFYSSGDYLKTYNSKTEDILNKYSQKGAHLKVKNVNFNNKSGEKIEEEIDEEVLLLIDNFFNVAKKYININIVRICNKKGEICISCGYDLKNVPIIGIENKCCPSCNTENDEISVNNFDNDISKNPGGTIVVDDESVNNFMKAFIRHQGLQPSIPNESIYEELDEYFSQINKPIGDEVKHFPLTKNGYRGDTSPSMLLEVLSKIKKTEYNEYVNYIGKHYWNWELPNLMHLHDRIKNDYLLTQAAYIKIPEDERERHSSLGTQFRLRMHLLLRGINRPEEEFKIAKNSESMQKQKQLWKRMCEECSDPEIRYLASKLNL